MSAVLQFKCWIGFNLRNFNLCLHMTGIFYRWLCSRSDFPCLLPGLAMPINVLGILETKCRLLYGHFWAPFDASSPAIVMGFSSERANRLIPYFGIQISHDNSNLLWFELSFGFIQCAVKCIYFFLCVFDVGADTTPVDILNVFPFSLTRTIQSELTISQNTFLHSSVWC